MAKKDIYKIDNYFIRIGFTLLIIGGLSIVLSPSLWNEITISHQIDNHTLSTYEDRNGRTLEEIQKEKGDGFEVEERSFPLVRSIMVLNGVILLLIGYTYRAKENKIIAVWNALEHTGEVHVPSLSISIGVAREFIIKHLKEINAQQQSAYTYDSGSDKIINRRLATEFLVAADCVNCGNKISQKVSLDLSTTPRCLYCGTGVPAEHLNKLKQEMLMTMKVPEVRQNDFSVPTFVALLIFFWPGAIFYLVKKKMIVT